MQPRDRMSKLADLIFEFMCFEGWDEFTPEDAERMATFLLNRDDGPRVVVVEDDE